MAYINIAFVTLLSSGPIGTTVALESVPSYLNFSD